MYSKEHKEYLKKIKYQKYIILSSKIFILITLLFLWEICAKKEILNPFLTSYPTQIITTIIDLFKENNLLSHIYITLYETIILVVPIAIGVTCPLSVTVAISVFSELKFENLHKIT